MTVNPSENVGAIAVRLPSAARILEGYGIDYCCGGGRSLADACLAAGVPLSDVVHSLEQATTASPVEPRDWERETATELIDHILSTHHSFTRSELTRLEPLLAKVRAVHGENHPELKRIETLFNQLKQELLSHMFKEEEVLFPFVVSMEEAVIAGQPFPAPFFGTVSNPIKMMMFEHENAGEMLKAIRRLSSDYTEPPEACVSYSTLYRDLQALERDLHEHIHLENNLLFPRAELLEQQKHGRTSNIDETV
jgi:regulator of cell morphogenesis and NO signaling